MFNAVEKELKELLTDFILIEEVAVLPILFEERNHPGLWFQVLDAIIIRIKLLWMNESLSELGTRDNSLALRQRQCNNATKVIDCD